MAALQDLGKAKICGRAEDQILIPPSSMSESSTVLTELPLSLNFR